MRKVLTMVAAVVVVGAWGVGAPASAQPQARERLVRPSTWTPVETGWKHLQVREGYRLYPLSSGLLMHSHPYVCAVKTSDVGEQGRGVALSAGTVGRFIDPVRTAGAAKELLAFLVPGSAVQDRAALDHAVAAFRRQGPTAAGYAITIHDFRPDNCGLSCSAEKSAGAFVARGVFHENRRQLNLVEVTAAITTIDGVSTVALDRRPIVTGPPTAWQTSSFGNETDEEIARFAAQQRRAYAEIARLKAKLAAALDVRRTIAVVRQVMRAGVTMKQLRAALGEADADTGSGIHIWHFYLADGTEFIVGDSGSRLHYATHAEVSGDGTSSKVLEQFAFQW